MLNLIGLEIPRHNCQRQVTSYDCHAIIVHYDVR